MMKYKKFLLSLCLGIFLVVSCSKNPEPTPTPPDPEPTSKINVVSQFVYDGLSIYYKWADKMKDKEPTEADTDPEKYFEKVLYRQVDKWSWITDDAEGLLDGFQGKSLSFGYNLKFIQVSGKIFAMVKYVFPGTPAAEVGLKRLDLIGDLNGKSITLVQRDGGSYISDESWGILFGNNQANYSVYKFNELGIPVRSKEVTVTPKEINTNPVLLDTVYTIGDKKIGYLFYTGFINQYNHKLYEAFTKFKNENVDDLVLDLRYNHGGAVSAATYLASLIAPTADVQAKSNFVALSWNDFINAQSPNRIRKLGSYDTNKEQDPLSANLNLSKVYVIDTGDSYSAAELTPFCLRPFMDVIHIGSKTGGKYTASVTLTPYNYEDRAYIIYKPESLSQANKKILKNWAMQPIVAIYTDKNNQDFSADGGLIPNYELYEGNDFASWKPLGDTRDVLLGQALYLITGDETYKPNTGGVNARGIYQQEIKGRKTLSEEIYSESVLLDANDVINLVKK